MNLQEAAKATAALVVGKRRRKKANYVETKLAEQPVGAASDGEGGADDPPSDADCVPTQDASSSDSDSDDESGQVRGDSRASLAHAGRTRNHRVTMSETSQCKAPYKHMFLWCPYVSFRQGCGT